ncbi:Heavy metal translocating P-type ATPase [Sulfurimonas denitrificans DSM 1251]|uniref:Copper-transporting ATPase n=1 Tax=Sulfurimonas denitrificans (strain ATCC 33889 / DSM 1251) TaxID=326298 RepID=Q30R80_SULDN|nr:copper-translocating P-type ATPase [Sulfurimonas denitrificans]ABB44501.1 Heavy metal translocating P-type ATPase [Sulfurimonas denitrificans DSM 1251]MDD3441683.1 copper-translocating P-type ATPase [Sulfurimonas denitrificans]
MNMNQNQICKDNSCKIEYSSYTCPMHPEIIRDRPGSCPKCGMALERVIVKADEENIELNYMLKRFWISTALTLPLFIVAMMNDLAPQYLPKNITMKEIQWFLFLFSLPVVLWAGWPFFVRGYNSLRTWNLNMFTLIAIGVLSAWIYSITALLFPEIFPALMRTKEGLVHVYFESAAVITTLVLLGQVLELKARSKTNDAIKTLLNLAPKSAHFIEKNGNEKEINLEDIQVGDKLRVKPGEKIPVDGIVIEGNSNIDESMITGEPIAVQKSLNDKLIGATINQNGTLVMQAQRVGSDTMLSQIVQMVSSAQRSRAPIQQLADTISGYFVPAVILCAIFAFLGWWVLGPEPHLAYAIVAAVSVLIIACPCALGLATPISIMVGTGRAALFGILIKDAQTLETMEKVTTLVVDKTGTLTQGKPKVTKLIIAKSFDENKVLQYGASLEKASEHPLAEAVLEYAKDKGISLLRVDNFNSITGKGIEGEVENKKVVLGSDKYLNSLNISTEEFISQADELRTDAKTVIFMAIDSKLSSIFCIEDPIKETSLEAIKQLKRDGIDIVMLSGDNEKTANAVAKKLGISKVHANVMPEDKGDIVKQLQNDAQIVAMAGDGINDAPALALADVGIAMGTGTDVAIQSAGITLIKGDLLGIVKVRKLSHATMNNIRQNLFFAFIYNTLGVPVAAGILYPFFGILLSPVIAATAMSFSSVSVILNALRLKNIKI